MFHFYQDGVEIVDSEKLWSGPLKKNQVIKKQISVRFTKKNVYYPALYFIDKQGCEVIKIYVGGAFEEDERVTKMRDAIRWLKEELVKPHINSFLPDTSVDIPAVDDEYYNSDLYKSTPKPEIDPEIEKNKPKNDSLLIELRKEYESLMNQLEKKRWEERRRNKPAGSDTNSAIEPGFYK